ncbi:MAG TPA: hypothetical protein VF017_22385 [Thermoanaerobaculia bacterium]|nr:hypothetical protein [Thermoanaerobaculia bacterium]
MAARSLRSFVPLLSLLLLATAAAGGPDDDAREQALSAGIDADREAAGEGPAPGLGPIPPRAEGPVVVGATLVAQVGQSPAGANGPITSLNAPFTNGLGQPGFTGAANDGGAGTDNFVWFDTGIAFLDADAVGFTLSGGESTMGVGDAGQFIYSPSVDGDDAVWTHNGLLLADGMQAPGFPAGTINTFNSRPQMRPSGQAYWVSGFNDAGGTTTLGRMLYTSSNAMPGTITVVLRSDDLVGGIPIDRPSGIGFDYAFSDDGSHHIHALLLDTGSTTNDDIVYVDGAMVAREASPSGAGDNWDNFDSVSINNAGDYLFSGDTDGATGTDEFIAYNSTIAVREGDVLDGQPLTSTASVQTLSLNSLGWAAHLWSIAGGTELLFFSCDAADLAATSVLVLATGDMVDLDGDTTGDATVTDFNASSVIGPGLSLAEDGVVYVEVDLDTVEAVIGVELPLCGDPPTITVAPASLSSDQLADTQVVEPLTVGNTGSVDLDFTITEAPADCGAPADLPWASAMPTAGTVASMATTMVDVTFDSTGLAPAVYTGLLCIASNDPANPLVAVPLTLTVLGVPSISVTPTALASDQGVDEVVVLPLDLDNTGTADLDFTITEAPADCGAPGDLPWASALPAGGTIAPAGGVQVDVTFDSTGLAPGVYTGLLCIASNDAASPVVAVPLTLTVLGGPGAIEVPALSGLGLAVLALTLAVLAMGLLRRRAGLRTPGPLDFPP